LQHDVKLTNLLYTFWTDHSFTATTVNQANISHVSTGWSKKTDTQFYFLNNFGNSEPILTILSLLQTEIYGA